MESAWLIPLFPAIIVSDPHYFRQAIKGGGRIYCDLARVSSFIYSLLVIWDRFASPTFKAEATWLKIGDIRNSGI